MTAMSKHRSCPLVPAKGISRSTFVEIKMVIFLRLPLSRSGSSAPDKFHDRAPAHSKNQAGDNDDGKPVNSYREDGKKERVYCVEFLWTSVSNIRLG